MELRLVPYPIIHIQWTDILYTRWCALISE
jgi:hypothetical protein